MKHSNHSGHVETSKLNLEFSEYLNFSDYVIVQEIVNFTVVIAKTENLNVQ